MSEARWSWLVTCEHASPCLPEGVELGLAPEVMTSHVSYDRGARPIASALARRLGAPLHLGRHSRLLVDLNRRESHPAVIAVESYGVLVPANRALDAAGRELRLARFHRPYREAVRADALRLAEAGGCFHLSVHAFDPSLDPARRAFDVGVLFDPAREPERALAEALAAELARERSSRLNEPYLGTPEGTTSWLRDQLPADRYVGLEIEASYAWMAREGALEAFAADLADALTRVAQRASALTTGASR